MQEIKILYKLLSLNSNPYYSDQVIGNIFFVFSTVEELCSKAKVTFTKANEQFSKLASKIPHNQYFRFNDHWRYVMQRYSFLAALLFYLESEKLALHSDVGTLLGGTGKLKFKNLFLTSYFDLQCQFRRKMASIWMLRIIFLDCYS